MAFFADQVAIFEGAIGSAVASLPLEAELEDTLLESADPITRIQYSVQRQLSTFRLLVAYCTRATIKARAMEDFSPEYVERNIPEGLEMEHIDALCSKLIERRNRINRMIDELPEYDVDEKKLQYDAGPLSQAVEKGENMLERLKSLTAEIITTLSGDGGVKGKNEEMESV